MVCPTRFPLVPILIAAFIPRALAQPPAVAIPQEEKTALKSCALGDMGQVRVYQDIYLAGQPSAEDLPMLKECGFKTVITVRQVDEVPWDEAAAVQALAMAYVQVPFRGPEQLTPKVFDDVLKVLRDEKRGPTLFHCGSANRVGAIWYAYRMLDGKLSSAEAVAEAKQVGLRTPGYLDKAREYVETARKRAVSKKGSPAP